MPDSPLPLPIARPHNNQQLFSDHYLDVLLPKRPQWRLLLEEAARIRDQVAAVFARFTPSANEAQTERDLVRPILELLGHTFDVQPSLDSPGGAKRPDYVFFRDSAAVTANKGRVLNDGLPELGGFAVGEAKQWDRSLDTSLHQRTGDPFSNKNPSYQIAFYMQHSGVDWGVLTNGRLWRIYEKQSAHKLDRFYEVDLVSLLDAEPEAFLYFYLFFRRDAFDDQPVGVAAILRESVEFAQSVGDSLKSQVFDALKHLAQGFLDYSANRLEADTASLQLVYDNALIVLYRLLFVLYAEDRDLLPVRRPGMYREAYSLFAIKRDVARDLQAGRRLLPTSAHLWPKLRELFGIIDRGSPPLKVATFNGGLFDPSKHRFLEQNTIGDEHLQMAIDMLARVNGQFVDYRDLSVRHLGTIYEGLLENHLEAGEPYPQISQITQIEEGRAADAGSPLTSQSNAAPSPPKSPSSSSAAPSPPKSPSPWIPALRAAGEGDFRAVTTSPHHPIAPSSSTLRLVSDKGERKATGSYYTPDYIVKYMVEQTVGPVLAEAVAGRADDAARIEAVLGVNVLDPAMGSGHFLVEATEFIARYLVDLDVAVGSQGTGVGGRGQGSGVAGQGSGVGAAEEGDLAYWKRRVVQSCIYGVDKNPLAVELAKLSLWLTTIASDRPLSFLDHHLRTGNALVGARLDDLEPGRGRQPGGGSRSRGAAKQARLEAAGQISMLADDGFRASMSHAVGNMWLIEGSEARTVEQVKQQEALYAGLRDSFTGRYGRLADLVTATQFGATVDPALWNLATDAAMGRSLTVLPEIAATLDRADAIAEERRFFHWELEFPEVFFDRHGRPLGVEAGFDAVIGNPPYVRQEQLAPFKPFFAQHFPDVADGAGDLFIYFFGQALCLLRKGGRTSYISSNSWLRANYATPLRHTLRTTIIVDTVVDLGDNHVFADAPDVYPAIHVVRNQAPLGDHVASAAVFTRGEGLDRFAERITKKHFLVSIHDQDDLGWQLESDSGRQVFKKIMRVGTPLGDIVGGRILYGIKTGLNDAFVIDEMTRNRLVSANPGSAELLKPMLRGEDLRPWNQEAGLRWLIVMPSGWTRTTFGSQPDAESAWTHFRARYPSVADHLAQYAPAAEKRCDKGEFWWELRSCDYYEAFESPKIFWPDIAKSPRFVWDTGSTHIGNTAYFIPDSTPYLLGILASRTTWFCISRLSQMFGERAGTERYRLFTQSMTWLPIPDAPRVEREAIGELAMAITEQARARYALHRQARHRLLTDFGAPGKALNQKLTAWWDLEFPALRAELVKVFRRDIPVGERDEWETWLAARRTEHAARTREIVRLETALNARVYGLFGLTPAESAVVEESTKYRYGEV